MSVEFDLSDDVVLVTGAGGALGSAVGRAFADAGAAVCAADVIPPDSEDYLFDADGAGADTYRADFTDEAAVADTVAAVVDAHGGIDVLCNIAGTWMGGDPVEDTDVGTFDALFDVNLKTAFLAAKHALPHLQAAGGQGREGTGAREQGAIVSVASRSSLSGGEGDAVYRASKAGVRLLTESLAEENRGTVRANAVMPSVIDTPMNREMMPDADFEAWVDPADIAEVVRFLASDAAGVTSGAAVPVYGEA